MSESDFPLQGITIYHNVSDKKYERYVKEASIRNNAMLNKNKNGFNDDNNSLIRNFDVKGYNKSIHIKNTSSVLNFPLNSFIGETWKVQIGDIIVNGIVEDKINTNAPMTELSKKYGKENVFRINSINLFLFNDEDMEELNHVKIGAI